MTTGSKRKSIAFTIGGIALVLNVTKNRQLTQIDSSRRFYSSYAKYTK